MGLSWLRKTFLLLPLAYRIILTLKSCWGKYQSRMKQTLLKDKMWGEEGLEIRKYDLVEQ